LICNSKVAQQSWENTVSEIRPTIGLSHQAAILDKKENCDGLARYDRSEYCTVVREGHGTVEKEISTKKGDNKHRGRKRQLWLKILLNAAQK
jgi:hypothetical protein